MPKIHCGSFDSFLMAATCLLVGAALLTAPLPAGWLGTADAAGADEVQPRYERIPLPPGKSLSDLRSFTGSPEATERHLRYQEELARRWHEVHHLVGEQHLSRKGRDLLRGRGLGAAKLDGDGLAPIFRSPTPADPDTLQVLIIRIAFEENRDPNLTTIAADGDFDLTDEPAPPDTLYIDPAPRNKAYFESHLTGLSEYYRWQSGGRLVIEGRVLPEGQNDSYKLTDVADYGPGNDGFWSIDSLERLVRDMIVEADQGTQADGSADLGDYDDSNPFGYVIFAHSGSDWQSDINGDSPNDIPTFFVTLGEPQDVANGQLSECSVIPETTNQDGYAGSIAAAFYHEFGHALGLVDIYSTRTGLPSCGVWDLMDSGTNLSVTMGFYDQDDSLHVFPATGVLPPSLSVWNKWFLGWVVTDEITTNEEIYRLPAVSVPRQLWDGIYDDVGDFDLSYPQSYRAGVSERDYFLLENRWVPYDMSETPFDQVAFEADEQTGVILYLAGRRGLQWANSGLYDYFLPGGGLLVWHINDDRVAAGLEDNTVNAYNDGIQLVEADGIQDIGVLNAYVLGWYGSDRDPYHERYGYQNLYQEGSPHSRCYDRSWTGVELWDVASNEPNNGSVMRFGASVDRVIAGFPWSVADIDSAEAVSMGAEKGPRALDPLSLTPVNVGGDPVLVFADVPSEVWTEDTYPTSLFALNADGSARWTPPANKPDGAFFELDDALAGPPVIWNATSGVTPLHYGCRNGAAGRVDLPASGVPASGWTTRVGSNVAQAPALLPVGDTEYRLLYAVAPDTLVLLDVAGGALGQPMMLNRPGGAPVTTFPSALRVLDFSRLPESEGMGPSLAVVPTDGNWFLIEHTATGISEASPAHTWPRTLVGTPQMAVVPVGDHFELHVFDDEGGLGRWSIAADLMVESLEPSIDPAAPLVTEPAVADLDADGHDDLVLATAGRILACTPGGVTLRGYPQLLFDQFPMADTTRIAEPLIVADGTGDGVNEVYFGTDQGHLLGLNATGQLLTRLPFRFGDRREIGFSVGVDDQGLRVLWLATAGGYVAPPLDRTWTSGRIGGFGLAGIAAEGTSEWLGPGGGSLRRGTTGEARDLGSASPASAEQEAYVMYPSPLGQEPLTIRFFSRGGTTARWSLHTLEGEMVTRVEIPVVADALNEYQIDLPNLASGVYVTRLQRDMGSGLSNEVKALAVER